MKRRIVITLHPHIESAEKADTLAVLIAKDLKERMPNLIDVNKIFLRMPKVRVDFSVTQPSGD